MNQPVTDRATARDSRDSQPNICLTAEPPQHRRRGCWQNGRISRGVGKVGEAAVLELGAKGLLGGLVQEGVLGVLKDRGVVKNDAVIIGAATAARPDTDGCVYVGRDLKRARGVRVPSHGEQHSC
jgi:hypothetical protein